MTDFIIKIWEWVNANVELMHIVALSMVYIAWQQWRTNRHKLKLELYDRRFKVYLAILNLLIEIGKGEKIDINKYGQFAIDIASLSFLFKPKIIKFFIKLDSRIGELRELNNPDEELKLRVWFVDQMEIMPKLFSSCLNFSNL